MMPVIRLKPIGTKTGEFPNQVPPQTEENHHLNIDEGIENKDTSTFLRAFSGPFIEEQYYGPVNYKVGEFNWLAIPVYFNGENYTKWPNHELQFFLDSVAVVPALKYSADTGNTWFLGEVKWLKEEFLTPLSGEIWNAATERTLRITITADEGAEGPTPEFIETP